METDIRIILFFILFLFALNTNKENYTNVTPVISGKPIEHNRKIKNFYNDIYKYDTESNYNIQPLYDMLYLLEDKLRDTKKDLHYFDKTTCPDGSDKCVTCSPPELTEGAIFKECGNDIDGYQVIPSGETCELGCANGYHVIGSPPVIGTCQLMKNSSPRPDELFSGEFRGTFSTKPYIQCSPDKQCNEEHTHHIGPSPDKECFCKPGFFGQSCGIPCDESPSNQIDLRTKEFIGKKFNPLKNICELFCVNGDSNPDQTKCICSPPEYWGGTYCEEIKCIHGRPNDKKTECTDCDPGWTGLHCHQLKCGEHTQRDIDGNPIMDGDKCKCKKNWFGNTCETYCASPGGIPVDLSYGGTTCTCTPGYYGYGCATQCPSGTFFDEKIQRCSPIPQPDQPCEGYWLKCSPEEGNCVSKWKTTFEPKGNGECPNKGKQSPCPPSHCQNNNIPSDKPEENRGSDTTILGWKIYPPIGLFVIWILVCLYYFREGRAGIRGTNQGGGARRINKGIQNMNNAGATGRENVNRRAAEISQEQVREQQQRAQEQRAQEQRQRALWRQAQEQRAQRQRQRAQQRQAQQQRAQEQRAQQQAPDQQAQGQQQQAQGQQQQAQVRQPEPAPAATGEGEQISYWKKTFLDGLTYHLIVSTPFLISWGTFLYIAIFGNNDSFWMYRVFLVLSIFCFCASSYLIKWSHERIDSLNDVLDRNKIFNKRWPMAVFVGIICVVMIVVISILFYKYTPWEPDSSDDRDPSTGPKEKNINCEGYWTPAYCLTEGKMKYIITTNQSGKGQHCEYEDGEVSSSADISSCPPSKRPASCVPVYEDEGRCGGVNCTKKVKEVTPGRGDIPCEHYVGQIVSCSPSECSRNPPSPLDPGEGDDIHDQPDHSIQIINKTSGLLSLFISNSDSTYRNISWYDNNSYKNNEDVTIFNPVNWGEDKAIPWDPLGAQYATQVNIKKGKKVILEIPEILRDPNPGGGGQRNNQFIIKPIKLNTTEKITEKYKPKDGPMSIKTVVPTQVPNFFELGEGAVSDSSGVDGVNYRIIYELTSDDDGIKKPIKTTISDNPCPPPGEGGVQLHIGCSNPVKNGCLNFEGGIDPKATASCKGDQNCAFNKCSQNYFKKPAGNYEYFKNLYHSSNEEKDILNKSWSGANSIPRIFDLGITEWGKMWKGWPEGEQMPPVKYYIGDRKNIKEGTDLQKYCNALNNPNDDFSTYCYDYADKSSSKNLLSPYKVKIIFGDL